MLDESVEVVAVIGYVLAGVIAVLLDEGRDLGLLRAVDTLDQGDAELAVVDAPDLHAAVGIAGTGIVDALDQRPAFHLDVKPRPLLDGARFHGVGDVIDLLEM